MDPVLREVVTTLASAFVAFLGGGGATALFQRFQGKNKYSPDGKKYIRLEKEHAILKQKLKEREKDIAELKKEIEDWKKFSR